MTIGLHASTGHKPWPEGHPNSLTQCQPRTSIHYGQGACPPNVWAGIGTPITFSPPKIDWWFVLRLSLHFPSGFLLPNKLWLTSPNVEIIQFCGQQLLTVCLSQSPDLCLVSEPSESLLQCREMSVVSTTLTLIRRKKN